MRLRKIQAAIRLQSAWRGFVVRYILARQLAAVLSVQNVWLGHRQRRRYICQVRHNSNVLYHVADQHVMAHVMAQQWHTMLALHHASTPGQVATESI